MIAQNLEFKLDPRIEKAVDDAYRQVESLYILHKINGDDWPLIYRESPQCIARINQIEDSITGSTPIEQVRELLYAWVKNYEKVFSNREYYKMQQVIS